MVLPFPPGLTESVISRTAAPLIMAASQLFNQAAPVQISDNPKPVIVAQVESSAVAATPVAKEQAAEARREGASQLAVDSKSAAKDSARTIPVPPEPAPAEAVANKVKTPVTPRVNIPKFDPAKVPEGLAGLRYLREQFKLRTDAVIAETEARGRAEAAEHRENARLASERADQAGKAADQAAARLKENSEGAAKSATDGRTALAKILEENAKRAALAKK